MTPLELIMTYKKMICIRIAHVGSVMTRMKQLIIHKANAANWNKNNTSVLG